MKYKDRVLYCKKIDDQYVSKTYRNYNVHRYRLDIKEMWRGGNLKTYLLHTYFYFISRGKVFVYYVLDGDRVIHISYVLQSIFKFPFLDERSLEIGPCETIQDYRNQGIYQWVLRFICYTNQGLDNAFIIVNENNLASKLGIEKAGFRKVGIIKKTPILKRYVKLQKEV